MTVLQAAKNSDIPLLIAAALAVMKSEAHKTASSTSRMYNAVGSVLRVLGIHHQRNVLLGNGLICVQVLIRQKCAPSAAPHASRVYGAHQLAV